MNCMGQNVLWECLGIFSISDDKKTVPEMVRYLLLRYHHFRHGFYILTAIATTFVALTFSCNIDKSHYHLQA